MIAIIKYNAGNIHSVVHALRREGVEPIVTDDKELIRRADKVIFPGVGEASTTMDYLKAHEMDSLIKSLTQPVLGICLGMQLMCKESEEGDAKCLGIFDVNVKKFQRTSFEDKIPHMGWNQITDLRSPLMENVKDKGYVYFVHSYYVPLCAETIAKTDYLIPFSAALNKDNFYATQFHPEKSGSVGSKILQNFLALK
ncbi:MAG: imidazole glycerol phosphate synthase subunit HisH [Paludibacteraceae bacterium]|nr:imidazole glycerol phosphate synthase subunit HisH [Paludibacteraceae bacterium]